MTTYGSNEALWILSGCLLLNPEWGRLKHWDYLQCSWIKKPHFEYTEQCGKLKPVLLHFNFHFIHLSLFFFTLQLKTRNLILSSYPSCHRPRDRVQFSNLSQTPLSVMLGDINCVSQIFFSYDVVANTVFSIAAYWIESIILSYKKLNMLHNWNVLFCDQINH